MNLRQALTEQSPSLALQRAAADEIARLDALVALLRGAVKNEFNPASRDSYTAEEFYPELFKD